MVAASPLPFAASRIWWPRQDPGVLPELQSRSLLRSPQTQGEGSHFEASASSDDS